MGSTATFSLSETPLVYYDNQFVKSFFYSFNFVCQSPSKLITIVKNSQILIIKKVAVSNHKTEITKHTLRKNGNALKLIIWVNEFATSLEFIIWVFKFDIWLEFIQSRIIGVMDYNSSSSRT